MGKRWKRWFWLFLIVAGIAGVLFLKVNFLSQHVKLVFIGYAKSPGEGSPTPWALWMVTNDGPANVTGFVLGSQVEGQTKNAFLMSGARSMIIGPEVYGQLKPGEGKVFMAAQPDTAAGRWRLNYLYEERTLKSTAYDYIGSHAKKFPFSLFPRLQFLSGAAQMDSEWVEKKTVE